MPFNPILIGRRPVAPRRTRMALLLASAGLGLMFAEPVMAQCVPDGAGTVVCSGDNPGINIFTPTATIITTAPGFSATTTAANDSALIISGGGAVVYIDDNASTLQAVDGRGLFISNATGGILVSTNGAITGLEGIRIIATGPGGIDVVATGPVNGLSERGIALLNAPLVNNPLVPSDIRLVAGDVTGRFGITTENRGSGSIFLTATGTVTGTGNGANDTAISAFISEAGIGQDIIIEAEDVVAAGAGVITNNRGLGQTSITVNGDVNATNRAGIGAINEVGTTDLSVIAKGDIRAGLNAISVVNEGTGDTTVIATGQLIGGTAAAASGMGASNTTAGRDMTVTVADVEGSTNGVIVRSNGSGSTTVTATGQLIAHDGNGLDYLRGTGGTGTTINVDSATATGHGIQAFINGGGDVSLTTTGLISGDAGGVRLAAGAGAGNVVVNVVDAQSSTGRAVSVFNGGTGDTLVTTTGLVNGADGGVVVNTGVSGLGRDVIVNVGAVTGDFSAVLVTSSGSGRTQVTATGDLVSANGFGLFASAGGVSGGDIEVNIVNAFGGGAFGASVANFGIGDMRVTATGDVEGARAGLRLTTGTNAGTIFADVLNATGGEFGISVETTNDADIELVTRGTVQGGVAGVEVNATQGQIFAILNSGTIRNSSGLSSDLAIRSTGGEGAITNSGTLLGTVSLGAFEPGDDDDDNNGGSFAARMIGGAGPLAAPGTGHLLINTGVWNSIGGVSEFLAENDVVLNQAGGRLIGGVSAGTAETTLYSGLETLTNNGTVTMRDGGVGDVVRTTGNATFGAGSTLAVDAGGAGSDRFIADGATVIANGAVLVVDTPLTPVLGTRYTVLQSAGGVSGTFNFVDQMRSAFLGFRDGYTATTVFVELAQVRPFVAAGETRNQLSVAGALDTLPSANPMAAALLVLPDDASARRAFDALSGEIHPGVRTTMSEDSRLPRGAVLARLDDRQGNAVWGRAIGNWGESDGGDGVAPLDRDGHGLILGADTTVGDAVTVGIAGAWLETDVDMPERDSSATVKSLQVLGYGGFKVGKVGVKLGLGYGTSDIETVRGVAFPGIAQSLTASYDGTVLQAFAEAGYRMPLGGVQIEPFAQVVAVQTETDSFDETGGSAALIAGDEQETTTYSTVGVRFGTSGDGAVSVRGMVGWQHGFSGLTPDTTFRFQAGGDFTVAGAPRSRDAAVATIDARWTVTQGVTVGVSYDGAFGSDGTDQSIAGALRIAF